jgi:hypothetical protein
VITMQNRAESPSGRDLRGDLVCTQCARVAGSVQGPNIRLMKRVTLRVEDPSQAEAVRQLRCPNCSGRLWLQNSEEIPPDPLQFDHAALRPNRGRPPTVRGTP